MVTRTVKAPTNVVDGRHQSHQGEKQRASWRRKHLSWAVKGDYEQAGQRERGKSLPEPSRQQSNTSTDLGVGVGVGGNQCNPWTIAKAVITCAGWVGRGGVGKSSYLPTLCIYTALYNVQGALQSHNLIKPSPQAGGAGGQDVQYTNGEPEARRSQAIDPEFICR